MNNYIDSEKSLKVLKQTELLGHQFTVYGTAETPLFRASDIAALIEHSNITKMMSVVDEDEKITIVTPLNQLLMGTDFQPNTAYSFLTEDGLYEVLMQSRKPIAKQFKKGVKNILKEIRVNGGYIATQDTDTPEMIMAKALKLADETIKRTQQRLQMAETTIEAQQNEIKQLAPLAEYTQEVLQSDTTYTFTQIAKSFNFRSVNAFIAFLIQKKVIYRQSDQYMPTAKYAGQKLFTTRTAKYFKKDGSVGTSLSTVITEKGRMALQSIVQC